MIITELPDYIQWRILSELEDPGFNVNIRRLMCTCKYYRDLIKNTPHLAMKICTKVPKIVTLNKFGCITIYFNIGLISTKFGYYLPLNKDRRTWGDLHNFVTDTELFNNIYRDSYIERLIETLRYSNDLEIKVPDHYYLLKLCAVIFTDSKWTFNLVCNDQVKYRAKLQDLDFGDPISILEDTPIEKRWEFLNDIAKIIELK